MSDIFARSINEIVYKTQTMFSTKFDKHDKIDQVSDEIELKIT